MRESIKMRNKFTPKCLIKSLELSCGAIEHEFIPLTLHRALVQKCTQLNKKSKPVLYNLHLKNRQKVQRFVRERSYQSSCHSTKRAHPFLILDLKNELLPHYQNYRGSFRSNCGQILFKIGKSIAVQKYRDHWTRK